MAKQVVPDPMGFPDLCIALPAAADDATIDELCQGHTARLDRWIEEQTGAAAAGLVTEEAARAATLARMPRYDGTVHCACQIYQLHPDSDFHTIAPKTRGGYIDDLKILESTIAQRRIRNVTLVDAKRWYRQWRAPTYAGGAERIRRAHGAMATFRTVLYFNAALGHDDCERLAKRLRRIKFERAGAREQEMTYDQVVAFIAAASELGARGIMPPDRALAMAIGTAAQFELMLRQGDIIGQWNAGRRAPGQVLRYGDEAWTGQFTWENIPGWRWRMKTSKSKFRAAAEFFLERYGLLFPLLERVPHAERVGAIVKGEHGLPMRENSYRKWFRQIRRAAGIPDDVWNMDTRAGGATEAHEGGAPIRTIQGAMTHSKEDHTLRYIRRRSAPFTEVADVRARKRAADESEGA
jgi:Phage integrase family